MEVFRDCVLSYVLLAVMLTGSVLFLKNQSERVRKREEDEREKKINQTFEKCEAFEDTWHGRWCVNECAENQIKRNNKVCVDCPTYYSVSDVSEEECLKCPNTEFFEGGCVPKKCLTEEYPLKNMYTGECHSCSSLDFRYSEQDCNVCKNREMKNGFCVFRNGVTTVERQNKLWKIPYVNGIEHGVIEVYTLDGYLFEVFEKINGKVEGEDRTFNKKGDVVSIIPYQNGKKNGKQIYYPHADGKTAMRFGIRQETDYVDGKREGFFRVYYENGKIRQETQLKDDKENGYDRLYNDSGVLLVDSEFENGKMTKSFCYTDKGEKRELKGAALTHYANGGINTTCDDVVNTIKGENKRESK